MRRPSPFGSAPVDVQPEPDTPPPGEDPQDAPAPPPEIIFRTPFPRPKVGALRNIIATVFVGLAILGIIWYFDSPAGAGSSQTWTPGGVASGPAPKIGQPAPDFTIQALDGKSYSLSDFRGRPVWINFWASWCPPCRAENPDIEEVYQANQANGLVVLGVAVGESDGNVRGYVERTGLNYTIGLDRGDGISANYRIVGIPTHYFIDKDGILQEWRIGSMSKKVMEKNVAKIVGGEAAN